MQFRLKNAINIRSLSIVVGVCFAVEVVTMFLMEDLHRTAPVQTAILNAFISAVAVAFSLAYWVLPQIIHFHKRTLDQARMMETLINAMPAPIFYKDEHGVYTGCNQRFADYIGRPADEIIDQTVYGIAPAELADVYYNADMELIKEGGTQVYETTVSHADGSNHDVMFHKAVFNKSDGSIGGIVGVILDISDRKELERKLQALATLDDLTQIPNRRELDHRLEQALLRSERSGDKVGLLFIDLDGFKEVNDQFGHKAGDVVLKSAADRITKLLRKSDVAGRMGGDEFAVVLEGNVSQEAVVVVADKLLKTLSEAFPLDTDNEALISASIGIAFAPDDGISLKELLSQADEAMYAAKNIGKNTYTFAQEPKTIPN